MRHRTLVAAVVSFGESLRTLSSGIVVVTLLGVVLCGCGSPEPLSIEGMVFIPAGSFIMGNDDGDPDEIPAHKVRLHSYYIAEHEVTNEQYGTFVKATGYRPPKGWEHPGFSDPKAPVAGVSWIDAVKYCQWLAQETERPYRLPTEAEWEKAARGTREFVFPWGDFWDPSRCNWGSEPVGYMRHTVPVGSFESGKSPYGVYDMAGNVWEWCWDWYDPGYYQFSDKVSPQGAFTGTQKVARGGCWNDNSRYCRTTDRWPVEMTCRELYVGFRVCLSK
ncbi:MAG TPA: formylglycine-generating enzyme family protein [bacterium]|nr:formylglycine-generating enzyme family protein [bacterium]